MRKILLAAAFSATFCGSSHAQSAPNFGIVVSSSPVKAKPTAPEFKFDYQKAPNPHGRASVGVGAGLSEGKPLEILVWSSGGAILGSLAGPPGAVIGAAAGAFSGLLFSIFVVPKTAEHRGADHAAR